MLFCRGNGSLEDGVGYWGTVLVADSFSALFIQEVITDSHCQGTVAWHLIFFPGENKFPGDIFFKPRIPQVNDKGTPDDRSFERERFFLYNISCGIEQGKEYGQVPIRSTGGQEMICSDVGQLQMGLPVIFFSNNLQICLQCIFHSFPVMASAPGMLRTRPRFFPLNCLPAYARHMTAGAVNGRGLSFFDFTDRSIGGGIWKKVSHRLPETT